MWCYYCQQFQITHHSIYVSLYHAKEQFWLSVGGGGGGGGGVGAKDIIKPLFSLLKGNGKSATRMMAL